MTEPQAPKHTALREALTDVMLLLDGLAGDGVGNTVSEGQTLWADTVYFALIEALGFSSDDDTPTAEEATAILLSAIEPDPSSSAQEVRAALEQIADPIAHFQREAAKQGTRIDGLIANALSNDPNYLKGIAAKALASAPPVRSNAEGEQ